MDGRDAVSPEDARSVERLLHNFLDWEPFLPLDRRGKIDLKGFAMLLAPQCRMLRDDVTEALSNAHSSLTRLATDWRELLLPRCHRCPVRRRLRPDCRLSLCCSGAASVPIR